MSFVKRATLLFCLSALLCSGCEEDPIEVTADVLTATENLAAPFSWQFEEDGPEEASIRCQEIRTDGVTGEVHILPLPRSSAVLYGLKPDARYSCMAFFNGEAWPSTELEIFTQPLPEEIAPYRISIPTDDPSRTGYTLVGIGNQAVDDFYTYSYDYTLIIDPEGYVRWYLNTYSTGSVDISYLPSDVMGEPAILWGGEGGEYVLPTIRNLDAVELFKATDIPVTETDTVEKVNHDAGLSANQDSIFYLTETRLPPSGVELEPWTGFIVKEVDLATNTIVWTWDSWEDGHAVGALEECQPGVSYYSDCFHANAIFDRWETDPATGDPRLYVYLSLRNRSRVLKIDYETKEVVWRLGPFEDDFTLLEPDGSPAELPRWFFYQHDVQIHDNIVSVYDNGKDRQYYGGFWYSRVVELELDEVARTATITFEYDEADMETEETRWKERVWGGYDILPNGERLVARGHCAAAGACSAEDENDPSALIRLAPGDTPELSWRLDFTDRSTALYRAEHIDPCSIFNNATLCPELVDPLAEEGNKERTVAP